MIPSVIKENLRDMQDSPSPDRLGNCGSQYCGLQDSSYHDFRYLSERRMARFAAGRFVISFVNLERQLLTEGARASLRARAPSQKELSCYSAFFLRRSTMIPKNRTASTAQTIRTVEESIVFLLS
jgi:hypothetical protein